MNLFSTLFRRADRRRSMSALLELDDRLLADIGLSRNDLRQMSRQRPSTARAISHE